MDNLNLGFLKSIEDLSLDEKRRLSLEEAFLCVKEMASVVESIKINSINRINQRLSTGNCFIKDDILFERTRDGEKAIWFPNGNAIEYQTEHGIISKSFLGLKHDLDRLNSSKRDQQDPESTMPL